MFLIGDVHGKFDRYGEILTGLPCSIQLGDMGIGFGLDDLFPKADPTKHRFLRGNHDNPELCRRHPNYLGDFGFEFGIFFISGAFSVDRHLRTMGRRTVSDKVKKNRKK